jgi:hypothetical protein
VMSMSNTQNMHDLSSRSQSVSSSTNSPEDRVSGASEAVASIGDHLHQPPLPTRNNIMMTRRNSSSTTSLTSTNSSSRKASVSEDKENSLSSAEASSSAYLMAEKARQEKISVKERTKTFNRMVSEVELANNVLKTTAASNNNMMTTSAGESKKRKTSRPRGSSSQRDDLDSHDSSSISTLDQTAKQWMVKAAQGDYITLCKMLRDDPRLAKAKDFINGYTALHWAAKHGNLDMVKLLAGNCSVDVNTKTHGGYTPLHLACQFGHQEIFDILVKAYGADQNLRDNAGKKPRQYMQMSVPNSQVMMPGHHMSSDAFRQLKDRRRIRNGQMADKHSGGGMLRFGSLSVKVKKTTEAFNNYFGNAEKKSSTGDQQQPYSLPMIGISEDDKSIMPPPKFAPIKKRRSKRAMDFQSTVSLSKSAPVTPEARSPIKEENAQDLETRGSDSDSEYGFDSNQWRHQ